MVTIYYFHTLNARRERHVRTIVAADIYIARRVFDGKYPGEMITGYSYETP